MSLLRPWYRQTDGVAIDSSLEPVLANIFVCYYEAKLFQNTQKPLSYSRYVDDIFIARYSLPRKTLSFKCHCDRDYIQITENVTEIPHSKGPTCH